MTPERLEEIRGRCKRAGMLAAHRAFNPPADDIGGAVMRTAAMYFEDVSEMLAEVLQLRAVAAARQEVIDGLTKRCEAFDAEVERLRSKL